MAVTKRSVSLDPEVAAAVEKAATEDGTTFSSWLSEAAERQILVRDGLRAIADWETENGALTPEERLAGKKLLNRMLAGR
jgi:hypothetical protein